jgi:hypothetical protein
VKNLSCPSKSWTPARIGPGLLILYDGDGCGVCSPSDLRGTLCCLLYFQRVEVDMRGIP